MTDLLRIEGKTTDGKLVVSGLYRLYETTGIPLDVILQKFRDGDMLPSWKCLIDEAIEAGANRARFIHKLDSIVVNLWGQSFGDVISEQLENNL